MLDGGDSPPIKLECCRDDEGAEEHVHVNEG